MHLFGVKVLSRIPTVSPTSVRPLLSVYLNLLAVMSVCCFGSTTDIFASQFTYCLCWRMQVFDVVLNGQITVVDGLDIFAKVGRGVAHDEIIPFSIHDSQLQYGTETVPFAGKLLVDFVKV